MYCVTTTLLARQSAAHTRAQAVDSLRCCRCQHNAPFATQASAPVLLLAEHADDDDVLAAAEVRHRGRLQHGTCRSKLLCISLTLCAAAAVFLLEGRVAGENDTVGLMCELRVQRMRVGLRRVGRGRDHPSRSNIW